MAAGQRPLRAAIYTDTQHLRCHHITQSLARGAWHNTRLALAPNLAPPPTLFHTLGHVAALCAPSVFYPPVPMRSLPLFHTRLRPQRAVFCALRTGEHATCSSGWPVLPRCACGAAVRLDGRAGGIKRSREMDLHLCFASMAAYPPEVHLKREGRRHIVTCHISRVAHHVSRVKSVNLDFHTFRLEFGTGYHPVVTTSRSHPRARA